MDSMVLAFRLASAGIGAGAMVLAMRGVLMCDVGAGGRGVEAACVAASSTGVIGVIGVLRMPIIFLSGFTPVWAVGVAAGAGVLWTVVASVGPVAGKP